MKSKIQEHPKNNFTNASKKSIIYLSLAVLAFTNVSFASNAILSPTSEKLEFISDIHSPLGIAISKGDVESVKKFIEYGADVNEKSNGMSPLMLAARYNRVEIIRLLIANGAKLEAKDENGFTALKYAELSNAKEAADFLKKLI